MDAKEKITHLIQRNQKRQGIRFAAVFSVGAIFGLGMAYIAYLSVENHQLAAEVASLRGDRISVNYQQSYENGVMVIRKQPF